MIYFYHILHVIWMNFPQMNLSTLKLPLFCPRTHCSNIFLLFYKTFSLLEELSVVCKQLQSFIKLLKPILEGLHYFYFCIQINSCHAFSSLPGPAQVTVLCEASYNCPSLSVLSVFQGVTVSFFQYINCAFFEKGNKTLNYIL